MRTAAEFGYRVREERERQGITQAALAASADVSVRWLSNFERGKSPRAELIKVVHVGRALGLAFALVDDAPAPLSDRQRLIIETIRADLGAGRERAAEPVDATSSAEPGGQSALHVMQSMLGAIGRGATQAQPGAAREGDDGHGEA